MQYYHSEGALKKLKQENFPGLVSIVSCWLVLKVMMPWTPPSALPSSPCPKVYLKVYSVKQFTIFLLLALSEGMQGCSKENKVLCPVTSAGFQSGMFCRFLGGETHYSIHTESSACSPWLCRWDPEDPKYILLAKAAFQWSVWPELSIYSQGHLCKIVVSLPQWHLNRKYKLISSLGWENTRTSL